MILMVDSSGLRFWNTDSDLMPIKISGGKTLQECIVEETEDYIIYSDGQQVKIDKYVTGTYDKYLERLKENTPMLLGLTEPTIDHARILNEINDLALEELAKKPLVAGEEPIILSPRVIPIPIDFCCRADKATGEIYIGEGYENLGGFTQEASSVSNTEFIAPGTNSNIFAIIDDALANKQGSRLLEVGDSYHFSIETKVEGADDYAVNGYPEANYIEKDVPCGDGFYRLAFKGDKINTSNWIHLYTHKEVKTDMKFYARKINFTKTSTPKPFVKSQMPDGKLSFVTNATSETHSFVMKGLKGSDQGSTLGLYTCTHNGSYGTPKGEYTGLLKSAGVDHSLISKSYSNTNVDNRGLTEGIVNFKNGETSAYKNTKSFKQLLWYKGNLTEAELKAENEKNIVLPPLPPPPTEPVKDGLVCWLDGRDGKDKETVWNDRSGNMNSATLTGFSFTADSGWTGKSLKFDGIKDFGVIAEFAGLTNTDKVTIEYTFATGVDNNTSSKFMCFAELSENFNDNLHGFLLSLEKPNTASCAFKPKGYDLTEYAWRSPAKSISAVLQVGNEDKDLRINNTTITDYHAPFTDTTPFNYDIVHPLFVGARAGREGFAKMNVASIKIYNRALTEEEKQQNYEYEQGVNRTVPTTQQIVEEIESYGVGLADQLDEEQLKTFRMSNDKTMFIAELERCGGIGVEKYVYSKALELMETKEWKSEQSGQLVRV